MTVSRGEIDGNLLGDGGLPEMPGGYVEEQFTLERERVARVITYLRPTEPDGILSIPEIVERFDRDGDAPYWTHVWPPAIQMAQLVYQADWPRTTRVAEIGCGVGIVALGAAARGWPTAASDNQPEAVRVAQVNAKRNGLAVEPLVLDWRRPEERQFDRILGCDVTYDDRLHEPLLRTVRAMLAESGEAWFADFGRLHAGLFVERAREAGFGVELHDEQRRPLAALRTAEFQLLILKQL